MSRNFKLFKYAGTLIIIGILIYIINQSKLFDGYSPEYFKNYIQSFGIFAPIVFIILFTLVPLTLFPDSILAIAGGMIFGITKGSVYIIIGAVCGGSLSFFISRLLGKGFVNKLIKKDINKLDNNIKENGFILILLLRLIPLFPFDIISYSAGLSKIRYKDFILATVLGVIPGVLVYANLGDKSTEIGSKGFYISIALLILLFVSSIYLKKHAKKFEFARLKKKTNN